MKTTLDEDRSTSETTPDYTMDAQPGAVCVTYNDIANLAFTLWQQRGCPECSADEDWFEAERRLLHKKA